MIELRSIQPAQLIMKTFINENKINSLLDRSHKSSKKEAYKIIKKSLALKGLSLKETAALLLCEDKAIIKELFKAAKRIKESIYGKRLVLFAPLYTTNFCSNNCLYCGFRSDNKKLKRKSLSIKEIKEETAIIEKEGQKRILLVAGEDKNSSTIDHLEKVIAAIYSTKTGNGEIRRLNVNVAPLSVPDFKRLKRTGIGTYQLFQETYHLDTYKKMHPMGPKSDYSYRLYGMHRAQKAGISDVGIGVLFGLYDFRFEVLALLSHAKELEKEFGAGPHTISVPRIEAALNTPLTEDPPAPVSDENFKKLVAILRLAVPYTGLILSTRESAKLRNEIFELGISQISAGSRTTPGGYRSSKQGHADSEQFSLHDSRSLKEVIKDISKMGYGPSFCTACYRLGRVGKDFMDLAKPGLIQKFCQPNSLLTFKEYLLDYGDLETIKIGNKVLAKHLADIPSARIRAKTVEKLKEIEAGKRDLYF